MRGCLSPLQRSLERAECIYSSTRIGRGWCGNQLHSVWLEKRRASRKRKRKCCSSFSWGDRTLSPNGNKYYVILCRQTSPKLNIDTNSPWHMPNSMFVLIRLSRPRVLIEPKPIFLHSNRTNNHELARSVPVFILMLFGTG